MVIKSSSPTEIPFQVLKGISKSLSDSYQPDWTIKADCVQSCFGYIKTRHSTYGIFSVSEIGRWITKNYRLATQIASTIGQWIAFTFMIAGIAVMLLSAEYQGFDPFSGLYLAFFGWFLQNAASVSYQQTVIRHNLEDLTVNQVMAIEAPRCVVSASLNLQQLAQEHIMPTRYSYLPVAEGGKLAGVITLRGVNSVPRQLWAFTSVAGVMHKPRQFLTISADQSALKALEQMEEYDIDQLVIVDEDTIVGVITKDALIHLGQNDLKQEKEETM